MDDINNLYLGDEHPSFMIGNQQVEKMYLGTDVVYEIGEFTGLRMSSSVTLGRKSGDTTTIFIKSSENWTLTIDSSATWLSANTMSGGYGESIIILKAKKDSPYERQTTITATSANFSATCVVSQEYLRLVDYIHKTTIANEGFWVIDTGIKPTTATSFTVKGMAKGLSNGNYGVGWWTGNDTTDYRLFWTTSNRVYFDFNSGRISKTSFSIADGTLIDLTCDNYSIYNNITSAVLATGTQQTSIADTASTISVNVGGWWLESLKIWDGQTKVFDGHAAKLGNTIGLYDSVSDTMFTNPDGDIAYEYHFFQWYVIDPHPAVAITSSYHKMAENEEIIATNENGVIPLETITNNRLVCIAHDIGNDNYYYIYYKYYSGGYHPYALNIYLNNTTLVNTINNLHITNDLENTYQDLYIKALSPDWELLSIMN